MERYIEIQLLTDPEFSDSVLMNALFSKLHRALAEAGRGEIGVSFPKAQKKLDDTIRLHGSDDALQRLMSLGWLTGLHDYTKVSPIMEVPDQRGYRLVRRVQAKSSVERLYRRSVKKGWISADKAEKMIISNKPENLNQPFVQLKSLSSGHQFRLFIQQDKLLDSPTKGKFSSYGLSGAATVPWF